MIKGVNCWKTFRKLLKMTAIYRVRGYCHKINMKCNRLLQNYAVKGRLLSKTSAVQSKFYCTGLFTISGVVTLLREHEVCKKGQTLTPEQCRILVRKDYTLLCHRTGLRSRANDFLLMICKTNLRYMTH